MSIKYLILDFGKVIARPTTGNWFAIPKFIELVNMEEINLDKFNEIIPTLDYILDRKILTEEEEYNMMCEFYKNLLEKLNYSKISDELVHLIAYDFTYSSSKYTMYDNIIDELEKLSNKYTLLMLTDNWPCVYRILKEYNIDKYFDKVYVSSVYDCKKKDGIFFDYPINDYDIKEDEAIFIDDNEQLLDIAQSKGLGTRLMVRNDNTINSNHIIIHDLYNIDISTFTL